MRIKLSILSCLFKFHHPLSTALTDDSGLATEEKAEREQITLCGASLYML